MKRQKTNSIDDLNTYVYVRISKPIKERIQEASRRDNSNMTIWMRQRLIKALEEAEKIK